MKKNRNIFMEELRKNKQNDFYNVNLNNEQVKEKISKGISDKMKNFVKILSEDLEELEK